MIHRRHILSIGLALLFAALCVTSLQTKSGTWDEYRIGIGARRDVADGYFHPPLSSVLHSLPFHWLTIPEQVWTEPSGPRRGQKIVDLRQDDRMLNAARIALLPVALAWLALIAVWSNRLYGATGAAIATTLFALDPNVIAHARLITPDTTLAATTLGALYALARVCESPTAQRRALVGVAFGLMFLAKFTALLLVPILLATHVAVAARTQSPERPSAIRDAFVDGAVALSIAAAMIWAAYGFSIGSVPFGPEFQLTLPAPGYAAGAVYQWVQSQQPHDFFLLGDHSRDGWWYFYAVVVGGKAPLGTLALLCLAVAGRKLGIEGKREELYLFIPGLLLIVYLSFFNTIHNGFRYLLPIWGGLLVFAGRLAPLLGGTRLRKFAIAIPLAALTASTLAAWPDYLAYCNALVGGSKNGYRVFSDSNLDWGQDLKALRGWMDEAHVDRIQLAYFGTADPGHWGIDYVALPSPGSALPATPPLPEGTPPPQWVALSAYQYQGVAFGENNPYVGFHALEPNARAGYSILLFDLKNPIRR